MRARHCSILYNFTLSGTRLVNVSGTTMVTGGKIKTGQQKICGWLSTILEVTSNRNSWTDAVIERAFKKSKKP